MGWVHTFLHSYRSFACVPFVPLHEIFIKHNKHQAQTADDVIMLGIVVAVLDWLLGGRGAAR